jgi:ATP-dependent DNA helicase RecG
VLFFLPRQVPPQVPLQVHRKVHKRFTEKFAKEFTENATEGSEKSSEKILQLIKGDASISAREIAEKIGISSRAVEKNLRSMKIKGVLRRVGPDKGGRWEIIPTDR